MIGIDITSTQNQFASRGIGNFTRSIIEECIKNIPEKIVLLGFDEKTPFSRDVKSSLIGLPSKSSPLTRSYYEGVLTKCINEFNTKNKDKITHYFSPYIHSGLPHLGGIKLYVFIHDIIQLHLNNYSEKGYLVNSIKSWIYHQDWRKLNEAELIFTNSQTSKRDMLEYLLIKRPIYVSYLGIDHTLYQKYSKTEIIAFNDQQAPPEIREFPYFLYFGGDEKNKNVPLIIDSFIAFLKKSKNSNYYLCLLGEEFERSKAYVASLSLQEDLVKKIIFLGYKKNRQKIWYISNALAFIHLSEFEGFGLSVLEVISCGTACILSDIPVYQELFSNCASFVTLHDREDSITNAVHIIEQIIQMDPVIDEKREVGLETSKYYSWNKSFRQIFNNIEDDTN